MRTPKTPARRASDEASEDEHSRSRDEALSENAATDTIPGGVRRSTASAPAGSGETQTNDQPSNGRRTAEEETIGRNNMGNEQSHESAAERSAGLHAAAERLLDRGDHNATGRVSTGKLKRPSSAIAKPVTRNVASSNPPRMRLMAPPSAHARPDPYDAEHSPDSRQPRKRQHDDTRPFSPLKRSKKSWQAVYQEAANEQLQDPDGQDSTSNREYSRSTQNPGAMDTETAYFGTWGRDRGVSQLRSDPMEAPGTDAEFAGNKAEAIAGAGDDEEVPEHPAEDHRPQHQTRRKRGRPRKDQSDDGQAVGRDAEKAPKEKKKRGRPSKDQSAPAQGSQTADITRTSPRTRRSELSASKNKPQQKKQSSTRAQLGINNSHMAKQSVAAPPSHDDEQSENAPLLEGTEPVQMGAMDLDDDNGSPYEPSSHEQTDDQASQEVESDGNDELERNPLAGQERERIVQVRPSEVFPDAHGHPFQSSPEKEKAKPQGAQKRKPVAAQAPRKRQRFAAPPEPSVSAEPEENPENEENESEENAEPPSTRRLYGQWSTLEKVCEAVEKIGVNHVKGSPQAKRSFKLRSAEVITIINSCNSLIEKLKDGREGAANLAVIDEQIGSLYTSSADHHPYFDNGNVIQDIYTHLFPKLVEVLRCLVKHYEEMDAGHEAGDGLTLGHLRNVKELVEMILDLGDKGLPKYTQPRSDLAIVGPVKNKILAPLKKMKAALSTVYWRREEEARYRQEQQREAEAQELEAQRERRNEKRRLEIKNIRDKWRQLHNERIFAEGFIDSAKQHRHLAPPEPVPEVDQNGLPFERLEVFKHRIGPSHAAVEAARDRVWDLYQLAALEEGLKQYKGPLVFEKIFRRYCGRHGELRPYNVTEIVTTAAGLREYLIAEREKAGDEVEDWLRRIPVWTRGHAVGKENHVGAGEEDF